MFGGCDCLSVKVDSVMVVKDEGRLRVDGLKMLKRWVSVAF